MTLDTLTKNGFETLVNSGAFNDVYGRMRDSIHAPKEMNGKKTVILEEDTVELVWTLGQLSGALDAELRAGPPGNVPGRLHAITDDEMRRVVENAIWRLHRHANRIAKLRLLLEQPDTLLAWLAISRSQCQQWIDAYEPEVRADATPEQLEAILRRQTPLAAYETAITEKLTGVNARIKTRLDMARTALEEVKNRRWQTRTPAQAQPGHEEIQFPAELFDQVSGRLAPTGTQLRVYQKQLAGLEAASPTIQGGGYTMVGFSLDQDQAGLWKAVVASGCTSENL